MAEVVYNVAKARLGNGSLDLDTDTIKVLILATDSSSNAQNPDTDDVATLLGLAGVSEMGAGTGTPYVRKTVSVTVTEDDANNRANVTHTNITWSALNSGNGVAVVYYEDLGADAACRLISYHSVTIVTNGGDITLSAPSDWLRIT